MKESEPRHIITWYKGGSLGVSKTLSVFPVDHRPQSENSEHKDTMIQSCKQKPIISVLLLIKLCMRYWDTGARQCYNTRKSWRVFLCFSVFIILIKLSFLFTINYSGQFSFSRKPNNLWLQHNPFAPCSNPVILRLFTSTALAVKVD